MTQSVFTEENLKVIEHVKESKEKDLETVSTLIQKYEEILTEEETRFLEKIKENLSFEIEKNDKLIKNFQSVLNIQKH